MLFLNYLDLSKWDTSKVVNMNNMFTECKALSSLNISHFNTVNVKSMSGMFYNCSNLKSLDLSSFETHKCKDFRRMFEEYYQKLTVIADSKKAANMIDAIKTIVTVIDIKDL